jgi:hypothetical protein
VSLDESNPISLCVPVHHGLSVEWPQRQRAITSFVASVSPFEFVNVSRPLIR